MKSRSAWDPLWKRQRRAHGPLKALEKELELLPEESEFTPQDDDEFEFNQDPPTEWNQDPPSEWWND